MTEDVQCWQIEVVAGPNLGAVIRLQPGVYTVSNKIGADIVLADAALNDVSAILELEASCMTARLADEGTSVGKLLLQSKGPCPREFSLGATKLQVRGPSPYRSPLRHNAVKLAGGVSLCLVLSMLFLGHSPSAAPDVVVVTSNPKELFPEGRPLVEDIAFKTEPVPVDGYTALAERIKSSFPNADLTTSAIAGGVIVTGGLPRTEAARWLQTKQWFDELYGVGLALVDETTEAQKLPGPHLAISAVRSGTVRYVITEQGEKLGEGAVIEGGWSIMEIRSDCVILGRDGRTVEITL